MKQQIAVSVALLIFQKISTDVLVINIGHVQPHRALGQIQQQQSKKNSKILKKKCPLNPSYVVPLDFISDDCHRLGMLDSVSSPVLLPG